MSIQISLVPHPGFPPLAIERIHVEVTRVDARRLQICYRVYGAIDTLVLAAPTGRPARRDELWKTTCFEAFAREGGDGYCELNFAPSGDWAAYSFSGYRAGMADAAVSAPEVKGEWGEREGWLAIEAELPLAPQQLALTAVIEERDGHKSYWSAAHPEGKPDFHACAGFVVALPT